MAVVTERGRHHTEVEAACSPHVCPRAEGAFVCHMTIVSAVFIVLSSNPCVLIQIVSTGPVVIVCQSPIAGLGRLFSWRPDRRCCRDRVTSENPLCPPSATLSPSTPVSRFTTFYAAKTLWKNFFSFLFAFVYYSCK